MMNAIDNLELTDDLAKKLLPQGLDVRNKTVLKEYIIDNFDEIVKLINVEISIEDARRLVKEIYKVDIPSSLDRDGANYLLETIKASTLEESYRFYEKAISYSIK